MEDRSRYDRRLIVPWYWWPPVLGAVAVLAAQLGVVIPAVGWWVPVAVLAPAAAGALWWLGRLRVTVAGGELRVDDARLPLRYVADAIPLDAAGRRELLGASADPLAFVVQRPWVTGAVQVVLDDPADPTPYWVVSAREPDRLVAALTATGRPGAGHPAPGSHAG